MDNYRIKMSESGLKNLSVMFMHLADDLNINRNNYKKELEYLKELYKSNEIETFVREFYELELDYLNRISVLLLNFSKIIEKRVNASINLNTVNNYESMSKGNIVNINLDFDFTPYMNEEDDVRINNSEASIEYKEVLMIADDINKCLISTENIFDNIVDLRNKIANKVIWDGRFCDEFIKSLDRLIPTFDVIKERINNRIVTIRTFIEKYMKVDNAVTNNVSNITDNFASSTIKFENRGDNNA